MALSEINVGAADHFGKGGVQKMEIASYTDGGQSITYNSTTNVATGTLGTTVVDVEFEKESAKMTISTSNEGVGLAVTTITIEGYVPSISNDKLESIQELIDAPLVAKVYLWNEPSNPYLVGWEEASSYSSSSTEFPLMLSSVEVDTGASLADQNGVTLTFTCKQVHVPAQF